MRAALAFLVVFVVLVRPADACSVCGCGDPMVDAGDSTPAMSPLRLALEFEYLRASAAMDGAPGTESIAQETVRPSVVWSPVRWLNLILAVPLVHKEWSGLGWPDSAQTGVGDVEVAARWFPVRSVSWALRRRQELGIGAGVSLPTGADDAVVDGTGVRLDAHAQLGSGAFGPYLETSYALHQDPWNLFASVTARVHTTSDFGYRYGTSVQWTVRADYRIVAPLAIELGLDGREAMRDTAGGDPQTNSGGFVLAASPGILWGPTAHLWLRARVQLPFVTDLLGEQSIGPTVLLGAEYLL